MGKGEEKRVMGREEGGKGKGRVGEGKGEGNRTTQNLVATPLLFFGHDSRNNNFLGLM